MIDIGANLAHDGFDADRNELMQRAEDAGVAHCVVTGSDHDSNARAAELAAADARLSATAGLHPHHAADWNDTLAEQIRGLAANSEIVAVGEAGLDYFRDISPREAQHAAFEAQLAIAADAGLPVFLHQREAHDDFHEILARRRHDLCDAVVHCFTDNRAAMEAYLDLDCHIGITGWVCDERRGQDLFEIVHRIPDNRLMIETDCPYLLPRTIRPKPKSRRNEPAYLPWVAERVAEARGQSVAHIRAITETNARRFFRLR